ASVVPWLDPSPPLAGARSAQDDTSLDRNSHPLNPHPSTPMSIQIDHVSKRFGAFTALNDVSLEIGTGELVALLGPSGCGKTTLLRIVAGLEAAGAGAIRFGGADATRRHVRERRVGFVFPLSALVRHMTVFENVAFGLTVRPQKVRPPK